MLLRRVSMHVKDQNWLAVGIDFFIVFVGVFVGLQVDNWNDARIDRRDEGATIRSLHNEMLESQALTANILDFRTVVARDIARATDVLFGLAPNRALTDAECKALAGSNGLYVGRLDLPALARLQSTGRMDIVRNSNLKDALIGLIQRREALETTMVFENVMHDLPHLYPDFFPLVSSLRPSATRDNGFERSFNVRCDVDKIRSNRNLMNDIALNTDVFDAFVRDGLGPWLSQVDEVHTQLDLALGITHDPGI